MAGAPTTATSNRGITMARRTAEEVAGEEVEPATVVVVAEEATTGISFMM